MQHCICLSFGNDETQSVSVVIFVSQIELRTKEALTNLSDALYLKYKEQQRSELFSKWFFHHSEKEKEVIRKNYTSYKNNFKFDIDLDDFCLWLRDIPRCSYAGIDGIGEIPNWEIRSGFLDLLNISNLHFKEVREGAEYEILKAISVEIFNSKEVKQRKSIVKNLHQ